MPLGTKQFDRRAGWMTLLVARSGQGLSSWRELIPATLADIGWRVVRDNVQDAPPAYNSTLDLLDILVRGLRADWRDPRSDQESEPGQVAVAALALHAVLETDRV